MTDKELAAPLSEEVEAFLLSEEAANLFTEEQLALLDEEEENLSGQNELPPKEDGGPRRWNLLQRKKTTQTSRYGPLITGGIIILFLVSLGGVGFFYLNREPGSEVPSITTEPRADLSSGEGFAAKATDTSVFEGQQPTGNLEPTSPDQPKATETERTQPPVKEEALKSDSGQIPAKADLSESRPANHYSLQVGTFLRQSSAEVAAKAIGKLDYRPEVTTFTQEVEMTRVRLTTLPIKEARSFLATVRKKIPNAFLIVDGDRASVYAGSFRTKQRARRLKARLAAEGTGSEEVAARVRMTMHKVTFGDFADPVVARAVGKKVVAAGLKEPELVTRSAGAVSN